MVNRFLTLIKRLTKIVEEIIGVLNSDREPNRPGRDIEQLQLFRT